MADRLAEMVIRVGGLAVLVAVLGIGLYLAVTVAPLFTSASATREPNVSTGPASSVRAVAIDEYRRCAAFLHADATVRFVHLADGAEVGRGSLVPEGRRASAISWHAPSRTAAIGFDNGSVRLAQINFDAKLLTHDDVSAEHKAVVVGSSEALAAAPFGGVIERLSLTEFREIVARIDARPPTELSGGAGAVTLIDYNLKSGEEYLVVGRESGWMGLELVRTVRPLGGGEPRVALTHFDVPFETPQGSGPPIHLFVTGDGAHVIALWPDGAAQRYSSARPDLHPVTLAESIDLLDGDRRVTAAALLLGGLTVLIGDDRGMVTCAFPAVDPAATTPDRQRLIVGHQFNVSSDPITSIGISTRDRSITVGDAAGRIGVRHVTSHKSVVPMMDGVPGSPIRAAELSPKLDGLHALAENGAMQPWALRIGYPEASFHSLFGKVHYEGVLSPQDVYQSSSGEDSAEIKLGLKPLIHGTIKATVFAMLFAIPLGVLAAIYTGEILDRRLKRVVKPTIEMMASLPSVVLGFIAAIVIAPRVRDWLPAVILAFLLLPTAMLLGAYIWQLIPPRISKKLSPSMKLGAMTVVAFAALSLAALAGGPVERALFRPTNADLAVFAGRYEPIAADQAPAWVGGRTAMTPDEERRLRRDGMYFRDGAVVRPVLPATPAEAAAIAESQRHSPQAQSGVRRWLDGQFGNPWPGWLAVLFAPAAALVAFVFTRFGRRRYEEWQSRLPRGRAALIDLLRFVFMIGASAACAALVATLLSAVGLDARDIIVGPYSQLNTLVVGFAMGFAVIPIIYTISEDALASVPDSLRSASLGSGATPWQTATRVVLPVAASGIFSAMMIGLGRAVGETMIVVMATGNTASMDWSVFSGFRTLSANIATELPEAAQGSTHYRVLFLCGLVLFVLTFVVNTSAEIVRQSFRRRRAAL